MRKGFCGDTILKKKFNYNKLLSIKSKGTMYKNEKKTKLCNNI